MSEEFISEIDIIKNIRKVISCYKGVFSITFDQRKLKDMGIMDVKFGGVPKDNALEIWRED